MNPKIVPVNRAYYHGGFSFNSPRGEKTKQNKTNKQTKPKVFWPLIAAYVSVKYIWTSWFCRVYHIFKSAIITKTTSRERLFEGPKNAKTKELSLSWENASLTRQHSLRSGVGTCKKILKIKIPFQILFYPFRCMFKIMKGYKNFDFTPSGKSLKKTLVPPPHSTSGTDGDRKFWVPPSKI